MNAQNLLIPTGLSAAQTDDMFLDGSAVQCMSLCHGPWIHNKLLPTKSGCGDVREREERERDHILISSIAFSLTTFISHGEISMCLFIYLAASVAIKSPFKPGLMRALKMRTEQVIAMRVAFQVFQLNNFSRNIS